MSVILSNLSELGFMNFDMRSVTKDVIPIELIQFGIWHNYFNNPKRYVSKCKIKNCKWGSYRIRGKYVTRSIKKYFGVNYSRLASASKSVPPYHFDGKFYHFNNVHREAVYFTRVNRAYKSRTGRIIALGEVYNADNRYRLGSFESVLKPQRFGGKRTWAVISMKTEYYK